MLIIWRVTSWEGEEGEWGKRCGDQEIQIDRYRGDRGMLRRDRKWSGQRTYMHDPWILTMV